MTFWKSILGLEAGNSVREGFNIASIWRINRFKVGSRGSWKGALREAISVSCLTVLGFYYLFNFMTESSCEGDGGEADESNVVLRMLEVLLEFLWNL